MKLPAETPLDYLNAHRKILCLIVLFYPHFQNQEVIGSIRSVFGKRRLFSHWSEFQLGSAFEALNSHFLELPYSLSPPNVLPSGAALIKVAGYWQEGKLTNPFFSAELAIIWGLLGFAIKNQELIHAGLELSNWHRTILDHRGFPFLDFG